jgi:hypothetical protein
MISTPVTIMTGAHAPLVATLDPAAPSAGEGDGTDIDPGGVRGSLFPASALGWADAADATSASAAATAKDRTRNDFI